MEKWAGTTENERRRAPHLGLHTMSSLGTGFFHLAQYSGDAPRVLHGQVVRSF